MPRRKPPVADRRQDDGWSCGAVAAAVALDLLGLDPDVSGLPANEIDGTDPRVMESYFRARGLRCQAGEMDVPDLAHHAARGRPVLCLVQLAGCGHWVTVYAANRSSVYLHCPQRGFVRQAAASFRKGWHDTGRGGERYTRFGLALLRG